MSSSKNLIGKRITARGAGFVQTTMAFTLGLVISWNLLADEPSESSEEEIEELIVNATRLPRSIEEIAGTVSAITQEDIQREIAEDLDDLIRYQPGVTMPTRARGGNVGFSIRGIGGNRVLTVYDGIRSSDIYHAGPSSYGRDTLDTNNIKSVEIIRGPASVLYGADAIGGVVLVKSKEPKDFLNNRQSAVKVRASAVESNSQYRGSLSYATLLGSAGFAAQFTQSQFNEPDVNGPGMSNPQEGDSGSLLTQLFVDVSENQKLRLSLDSFSQSVATDLASEIGRSVSRSEGVDDSTRLRVGARYNHQADSGIFDNFEIDVNVQQTDAIQSTVQERVSYSFISPRDPRTYGGTQAVRATQFEFNQEARSLTLNLVKSMALGDTKHALAYGVAWDSTETERPRNRCEVEVSTLMSTCSISAYPFARPEVFPNKTIPDTSTSRTGAYVQNEISFAQGRLKLIPGIRYDRYELSATADPTVDGTGEIQRLGIDIDAVNADDVSLNLGGIYDLTDTWMTFIQYAEGFRPPNFAEVNQSFVNLGFGYATVPNAGLVAEKSKGIEVGFRGHFANNNEIGLAIFSNRYTDFIETNFVGRKDGLSLFQNQNLGEVEIRGYEANLGLVLNEQWQAHSGLAFARGDNVTESTPLDSVDPLTIVSGVRYTHPSDRWGMDLRLTTVGKKDRVSTPERVTASAYQVVDLLGHFSFSEKASLRLGIFNLFDEQYARWTNISSYNADSTEAINNAQEAGTSARVTFQIEI